MAEHARSCASCGTTNEEDARFCDGCGGSLARVCGTCGVEARAEARFCRGCGASLDATGGPAVVASAGPVRKTVTVMFADLAGSTSFEERVDAETAREVVGRYHDLLRTTAQRHRAGVTKYIGDGFMAVWGVPETGLDDAGRAIEAGVELQDRFVDLASSVAEAHGVELALRVAVNTGEVVIGEGDADIVGDALNVAARLEGECPRGHVVVGEETWRSTRGQHRYDALGQVQVKGRTTPVAVFQWLGRQAESADAAPFVGRADEVRRLEAALDDATGARAARMVTLIGDPGVGKTRLAAEFAGSHPTVRALRTRCNLEETVALAPIVELLRSRDLDADVPVGAPERDRMLRDLNGLAAGVPGSVEETFWALRRFVEALAVDGPLLIVLDDLQWADSLLLDFVEHLVEWVSEAAVLIVALARPELREVRADFATASRWVTQAVHLGGLDPAATAELAAEVLGGAQLPDELLRRLPSSTGGNPLFVRELIGMLVDDEVLVHESSGWRLTIDVDAITIPPTIHALLASRLERLDAPDRRVLEIASVFGTDFSLGAVAVLAGRGAASIKPSFDRLRRLQLAQPSGAYVGDEPVWRFHHVLIRDVAYRRLLKSDRADLHERLADWVEAGGATLASDPDEMVARHLESAHGYRRDLGTLDDRAGGLALRSARCYLGSARRALDRDELAAAGSQAARGAALAIADDVLRAELLLIACEAFLSAGQVSTCAPLVDDFERIVGAPLAPWATCYRCQFVVYTEPERLLEVDARLQDAIDEFGRRKDAAGLAKAHRVRAGARARLGRIGDAESDLLEALIAARQSGDQRQITAALSAAPSAALWGPSPVPKAGGRCLDVVRMQRMATAAPSLEATSLRCLAVLELLRGRPDKARSMLADARQVVADLGLRHGLMETELFAGIIESMVGDPVAAEPHFRTALEGLGALGVGADAGLAAALLARALLAQGRIDDAVSYATESERLAGHNLKTAVAWRAVRAEILCAQKRYDDAVELARDAVAVAGGTDLVLDHADACLALGRVLHAAGNARAADAARRDAEALYAAKEVVGSIGRAVEPAAPVPSPPPVATPTRATRLEVVNRASETWQRVGMAMSARDVDSLVEYFSDELVHDDRPTWSGAPPADGAARRAAIERYIGHYSHHEGHTLAVRGERGALSRTHSSDDAGNEKVQLHVVEVGDDDTILYWGQFDEDDFEGAYRELDRRYYAGAGAAFAEGGAASTEFMLALSRDDIDGAVKLTTRDFRLESRSSSVFGDRFATEWRASREELSALVESSSEWLSAVRWLSPTWGVCLFEREATGLDGEDLSWTRLGVFEVRGGRITSMCTFDPGDEDAAFAYAEERVRATTRRLAVTNRASETFDRLSSAMEAADVDTAVAQYADGFEYDDRRGLSGDPIEGGAAWRAGVQRFLAQYSHHVRRMLAVRGDRLALCRISSSDDAGNETVLLNLVEIGDDGLIAYHGRFDDDDFEGAYRELERRYYSVEGAAFASGGAVGTEWMIAMTRGDLDTAFGTLTAPDFHLESRSGSVFGDRSAAEHRASLEELSAMVASVRTWLSVISWLTPAVCVVQFERETVGLNGEEYSWTRLGVVEICDGRVASMCDFDPDAEEEAFAYAEERARATVSRLAVTNVASETLLRAGRAFEARDVDGVVACQSTGRLVYDDKRALSGSPIVGRAAWRAAVERVLDQYSHFEGHIVAVRGERLALGQSRWSDDDGNATAQLHLVEVDDDGRITFESRFDEDDFERAYLELDRRYYAGEGAAFAEGGGLQAEYVLAANRGELDRVFDEILAPNFRNVSRSRSVFGDRSVAEFRTSLAELSTMVESARAWVSAVCWLSPAFAVTRTERIAVGLDGEEYAWTKLYVGNIRDGRIASFCEFDVDDEDAAFAYAEERVRAAASRLPVANRASEATTYAINAMRAHGLDAALACFSDRWAYDDRRALSGDPIGGSAALRAAMERILLQYNHFEWRTLAVRGDRLTLAWSRWWDDARNETAHCHVYEVDDDGLIASECRFDEDDFDEAIGELDRRYFAGEAAAFADSGAVVTAWMSAMNRGDLDGVIAELCAPDFRATNRSRSVFADRSADELRSSTVELGSMVASSRSWTSAALWLSPTVSVSRFQREAVGPDGVEYAWTQLTVAEIRAGRLAAICQFEPDDEDAAFAYAEERVRASISRLPVTNRATETLHRVGGSGASHVEERTLAVRGERLALGRRRWSDGAGNEGAGNESVQLHLIEVDDEGLTVFEGRFDEGDFETAYRELEQRYYAGEGAAFAEIGAVHIDYTEAVNRGDLDRVFDELTAPDFRVTSRSRSVFGDRSAAEFRASLEELDAMVASARTWYAALRWLTPTCCIMRMEREAVGHDDEQYSWTRLNVAEIRDGVAASICEFNIEDEEQAFAYAEELVQASASRLSLTNRASGTWDRVGRAMSSHDLDGVVGWYSDGFVYDDRRGLSGDPIEGGAALRAAAERVLGQYSHFEAQVLAVRGDRLVLSRIQWSDDAGNQTVQLLVYAIGNDQRIVYEGRFDEDDFEGAYRELEKRYYACEGAALATPGLVAADYFIALNRGDFDKVFSELTAPGFRGTSRSRSVFGDRSAAQYRASVEELAAMVASAQSWVSAVCWLSPTCGVLRFEREAVGVDGEKYSWTRLTVTEVRCGRVSSICEFDSDDEDAAFAYAEALATPRPSRLLVDNVATQGERRFFELAGRNDFESPFIHQHIEVVDRRAMPGEPYGGREAVIANFRRLLADYPDIDVVPLAVRGEVLALVEWRCRTPSGFEATYLNVHEVDDAGHLIEQVRFDGDDFEGAYRELERRYYAGEGAEFADGGALAADSVTAINRGDLDKVFGELTAPDFRSTSRSRSVLGDRSAMEYRSSIEELIAMVASLRMWHSAVCWLSPTCAVIRMERAAVGLDGEKYGWAKLYACECRDGRATSICEFDADDEDAAFVYAEQLAAAPTTRLAVSNLATEGERNVHQFMGRSEFDSALVEFMHPQFRIIDRRAMSGAPFLGREAGLANFRRLLADYPDIDIAPLAVRGQRLALAKWRCRTPSGYEATYLNVNEVDESGQLIVQVRFDGDDFEGAYRELEQRYYADEGAAFAVGGAVSTDAVLALNRGEFDGAFGELVATDDYHVTTRSRSVFGDRSAAETRAGLEELAAMVASVRMWFSVMRWLSPTCCVVRQEREAVGADGEEYSWTRLYACEFRGGRVASMCQFELENEDDAFAHAEQLVRSATPRPETT